MLDPEQLLAELVSIPSPSGNEEAVSEWMASQLKAASLPVQRVGKNLVVDVVGGPGPTLMFASHLDTVPAGLAWSSDPYAGIWKKDKLVGLGSNDAGACVVAICCAVECMAQKEFNGTLRLALVVEEETSNAGMAEVLSFFGKPDMAVVGEPTALKVVRIQSGLAILHATWSGRSCHAAHAANLDHQNALMQACRDMANLPDFSVFPTQPSDVDQLAPSTLVPAILKAGDHHNRIPDQAIATFDVRLTPPDSAELIANWLQSQLPNAEVSIYSDRLGPMETPANHELVISALRLASDSRATASNTMSDMALLQGVPAIKCGPGESNRSHTPDEFITRQELLDGIAFYSGLAADLFAVPVNHPVATSSS